MRRAESSNSYRPGSSSGSLKASSSFILGGGIGRDRRGRSISPGRRLGSVDGGEGSGALMGPYGLDQDERRPATSQRLIDKQSILWRDFTNGVKRRKRALKKLGEVAEDPASTSGSIKRLLLEIREMTLRLVEDALEIEYKAKQGKDSSKGNEIVSAARIAGDGRTAFQNPLPPINSYKGMEDKEDVLALADIISDVDDLYSLPNIRVFLPMEFPATRNPFLLGKSVDELAEMVAPKPTAGNLQEELKVLEIMRYKRTSRALLRAESQVTNKLPLFLPELENIWHRMARDPHTDRLVRCCLVLLDNDRPDFQQDASTHFFTDREIRVEPYEFLNWINRFVGQEQMRVDIQAQVRKALRDVNLEYMDDGASTFLIEWVNSVLSGTYIPTSDQSVHIGGMGGASVAGGNSSVISDFRNRGVGYSKSQSLGQIRGNPGASIGGYGGMGDGMGDLVSIVDSKEGAGGHNYTGPSVSDPQGKGRGAFLVKPKAGEGSVEALQRKLAHASKDSKASDMDSVGGSTIESQSLVAGAMAAPSDGKAIVPPGGAFPRKKKKKKETDKERKKRQKEELSESIAVEVNRILKEQGLSKRSNDDEDALTEEEKISSLRYELVKMQQELLRRQVLDPRYYEVASLDKHALQERGLTVPTLDTGDGSVAGIMGKRPTKKAPAREMFVCEKRVPVRDGFGSSEVILDLVADNLRLKLARVIELDEDGQEVSEEQKISAPEDAEWEIKKEPMAAMTVSKLMLNRLTNLQLDDVIDEKDDEARKKKLFPVMDQLRPFYQSLEPEEQEGTVDVDRTLLKTAITYQGIAMDVVITRNTACDGVTLELTPLSTGVGDVDSGPMMIDVADRELQILLINQRGLYLLSQSKWSCMEMVAQWLSSRIQVKRIAILGPGDKVREDPRMTAKRAAAEKRRLQLPGTGTGTLSPIMTDPQSQTGELGALDESGMTDPLALTGAGTATGSESPLGLDFADLAPKGRKATMLEVKLDRQVEVSNIADKQWRTRNVPAIKDMTVSLEAWQELDMVRFDVALTFPHPSKRRAAKKGAVMDFSTMDATRDDGGVKEPVVLRKSLSLTATELSIFGVAEAVGERKVSMSTKTSGESHPAAFMWNVLSRLKPVFSGSTAEPYSRGCKADDPANWELAYDRRLFRDVRSISGCVMTVDALCINGEILYRCDPTDGAIYRSVGAKLMEEHEINQLAYEEAWPLKMLNPNQRAHLAYRMLEKMKVVSDKDGNSRLELYTFPESRLLFIFQQNVPGKPDIPLGSIEINDHQTLADLRVMIKHELDRDLVPRLYRFFYKGGPCAVRQEPFRRAWEVLPQATLIPRTQQLEKNEKLQEAADKRKAEMEEKMKSKRNKLKKDQRRAPGGLVPVPIYTLCRVQEETGDVYLLHDSRGLVVAGDVIRIGSVLARDYIIALRSKAVINANPRTLQIDPAYDLIGEDDFELPLHGMAPFPKNPATNPRNGKPILPGYEKWGIKYDLPKPKGPAFDLSATLDGTLKLRDEKTNRVIGKEKAIKTIAGAEMDASAEAAAAEERVKRPDPKGGAAEPGAVWRDVWMWKCIPPEEDTRPDWRKAYDDGTVGYEYEFADSAKTETNFRVKARLRLMEVLCADVRCPDMTIHCQRVEEMSTFDTDYYCKLAFRSMTEWFPQYKRGVESSKFMKMVRNMQLFPDIKRPARVSQLDLLFMKEATSDNGINDKYVNYVGFCRLVQALALIRYPPPGAEDDGDAGSVGGNSSVSGSVASKRSKDGAGSVGSKKSLVSRSDSKSPSKKGGAGGGSVRSGRSKASGGATSKGKKGQQGDGADEEKGEGDNEQVAVDPEHAAWAHRKVVLDYLLMVKEWSELAWTEAKRMAMSKEAKKYSAATRITAAIRGWLGWLRYGNFRYQLIVLQSGVRRRQGRKRHRFLIRVLEQDWLYRVRYHAATRCQALIRRFISRARHFLVMKARKEEEVKIQRARRYRLKKVRQKEKKGILYREVKRVNGIMVMMYIARKDNRNYSKDFGILIRVYIPKSSQTFKFIIEEPQLRKFMETELAVEAVGVGDLLDKRNLQAVVSSRLIIRKSATVGKPPQVIFSKQAMGQRGALVMTEGKIVDKEYFVCKVYETGDDLTVTCYHRQTCKMFQCQIGIIALRRWVTEEHKKHAKSEAEAHLDPQLLKPDRKRGLYVWAVDHIRTDTRKGQFRVMFEVQLAKSRKGELLALLQAHWRRCCVRTLIQRKYDEFMVKVQTEAWEGADCYYIDRRTGASQWEKPRLLSWRDLSEQPSHRWVDLVYYDEDGNYYQHFVNPWTGKFSHLTQERAARIMQATVRNYQMKHMFLTKEEVQRVVPFVRDAKRVYEATPTRLMAVINYALVAHTIYLDEELAKRLYIEAVGLAEANPLVTRAFGLFVLSTCEAPIKMNRERALRLLSDAQRRDEEHRKFEMAYVLYKFANLRQPRNVFSLVNRALVDTHLYNKNWQAERFMRRALSIAPFEPRVLETWSYLRERFPERQVLHNMPARIGGLDTRKSLEKPRVIHGRPAFESPKFAGWTYVEHDEFAVSKIVGPYWYNPATGEESEKEPEWPEQWEIRRNRSTWNKYDGGLHHYFDPLTSDYFVYHELSNTFN